MGDLGNVILVTHHRRWVFPLDHTHYLGEQLVDKAKIRKSRSIQLLIPGVCVIYSITHCPSLCDSVLVFSAFPCPMVNNKAKLPKSVLPALVRITKKIENRY